jgi:hypothetical protein
MSERRSPSADSARLDRLERRLRWTQGVALVAGLGLFAAVMLGGTGLGGGAAGPRQGAYGPSGPADTLQARVLEIVDAEGRPRVVLGAPLPAPAPSVERTAPMAGLAIFDTSRHERFGTGLQPDGRMVMGFDAPPGVGSGGNPERINLVANSDGTAFIRLLGQDSFLESLYRLNSAGEAELQFLEVTPDSVLRRRYSFEGTEVLRQGR